jgi:uncharacterized phage protein (TIGR02218 family)
MKSISNALNTHLSQEVTTICSCWKIVRKDGQEFYFTDHDQDVIFEGNTYEAESSYDRTAIQSGADFSVDNLDVTGILDSTKISAEEVRAGLFNRADVYVFVVNWKDPTQGALKIRRGWFGEVTLIDETTFTTEIRGLLQALSHDFLEVYSNDCRANFCDTRCRLDLADYQIETTVLTSNGRDQIVLSPDISLVIPEQGFDYGSVVFVDGPNAGRLIEIIGWDEDTLTVDLFEGAPYAITPGTAIKIAPGCDGSLASCKAYNNVINRRAEDYVPGNDTFMQYPDANY